MVIAMYSLAFILMVGLPIGLGYWIASRYQIGWRLFGIGAATFIGSQILHIPFNLFVQSLGLLPTDTAVTSNLIIMALFGGLSAGIFEESARYLTYRYWARDARSWDKGLMVGAGHGGIEAILIGIFLIVNVVVLTLMRDGQMLEQIPPDLMPQLQDQISATFDIPFYQALLPAVERLFAITFHIAASLMVMQVFVRKQRRWFFFAILWHTLINAIAVYAIVTWNALVTEGLIGIGAVISLGIIFWLKT